jgi:predicted metal-dependent enzyme (double-stranded beta helix superfamily)
MFDKDRFIEDCIAAAAEGQGAVRELVARAVADPAAMLAGLGEPEHAGIRPLYSAPGLTIIHFVWAPCMSLMPHNHQMYSVVGIYAGREDNLFWRRTEHSIEVAGGRSLGVGDVAALGPDAIHSVLNPIAKMSCAIHVYGGDFFHPPRPRSQWDHETLAEEPWNVDQIKALFGEAERRFYGAAPPPPLTPA